ncbi:hypothetical protein COOONC_04632 [Cooperia oncophora]
MFPLMKLHQSKIALYHPLLSRLHRPVLRLVGVVNEETSTVNIMLGLGRNGLFPAMNHQGHPSLHRMVSSGNLTLFATPQHQEQTGSYGKRKFKSV